MSQPAQAAEMVGDGLVTVEYAAEFLGLARSTLYELMDAGKLHYVKIGRARRIPKRAVIAFAAANLRGGWSTETAQTSANAAGAQTDITTPRIRQSRKRQ